MALPAAGAALTAARTVGSRAFAWAQQNLPAVAEQAKAYLDKSSGGKADSMLISKNEATNQAVVKALLDRGLPATDFAEITQLTQEEARVYAQMIASYMVKQANAVDKTQTPRVSTGDVGLDHIETCVEVGKVIKILGINSDQYAFLIRCFNTHTSSDVERFQLDRKMRGLRFE